MIVLGLTGSIGMGKSTTSAMFTELGVPVHDADATVHRLYASDAAAAVEDEFPGTVMDGVVDRNILRERVIGNRKAMKRLEEIIHPFVRREEQKFIDRAGQQNQKLVILDIPLLLETGGQERVDGIVVVTAPADVQRERVLARDGMSAAHFEAIVAKQIPDEQKKHAADFIIDTSLGLDHAKAQVREIVETISDGNWQSHRDDRKS